jgi:hypothetical protein
MRNGRWASLERLLARQHGVVAMWQVIALGIPHTTFIRHARTRGWTLLGRAIWAAPWSVESFTRRCVVERIRGRRARLVTGGAEFVLLEVRRLAPSAVDLWVRPGVAVRRRPGVVIHRSPWVAGDRLHRIDHVPCTPPLRALRDAAARSTVDRLERDLRALDRLRHATPEQVAADLDRRGRFPGRAKVVEALGRVSDQLVHSDDEGVARRLLTCAPVAPHRRPLLITRRAQCLGEIDIPFCAARYGVEIDGPAHREDGEAERDRVRDRRLEGLYWVIERFTDEQLRDDPDGFVRAVLDGHAAAAARCAEPWACETCAR